MNSELLAAMITCAGSVVAVIFFGGRQVGRVEAAIIRLTGIEERLKKVDEHAVMIGTIQESVLRMRSDHKELKQILLDNVKDSAEIRGRLESKHDGE